jgi:hypothetical protein
MAWGKWHGAAQPAEAAEPAPDGVPLHPRPDRQPQFDRFPDAPGPRDIRFRILVGSAGWSRLPLAVQRRFSKRLGGTQVVLYRGTVVETRLSRLGCLLAQLLRPMGAPLPLRREAGVAAVVCVSEDAQSGGQIWSRLYVSHGGFPQVIHSTKSFAGPTGLEEQIGLGIGMALRVEARDDGLLFTSDHYVWYGFGHRWRLPNWLTPGKTVVTHRDRGTDEQGRGCFAFDLDVRHPWFGELLHQHALFSDQ